MIDWETFLREWDTETRALLPRIPDRARDRIVNQALAQGIRHQGASDPEVTIAEQKLATHLPRSLKDFYRASNGLRIIGLDAENGEVWPLRQLRWLRDGDPDLVRQWEAERRDVPDAEYFRYGPGQKPMALRSGYFGDLLQLSGWIDAAMLMLNPRVVDARGEWEAWFYGAALPGARRFPGFTELMMDVRERSLANVREAFGRA